MPRWLRPPDDDAGTSLVELMVTLLIMSVLGVMVDASLVQIFHSVSNVTAASSAQTQINQAFVLLDKEIRYARSISNPTTVSGDYYVEYLVTLNSVDTCVELRLSTSLYALQRRSWPSASDTPTPTAWTTLASDAYPATTGTTPFTVTAADSNGLTAFRFQRLGLNFMTKAGAGSGSDTSLAVGGYTRITNVTFSALNATGTGTTNATTCTQAQGIAS